MIYLDSAATSLLKPDTVQYAMINAMNSMASPGRGSHEAAMRAAEECYDCRENLARLFHMEKPENVVFTFNATHGLNIAIDSLVKPGARVLVSGYEHNSVMRPLYALKARLLVVDTPLFRPDDFLEKAERLLPRADVVVCNHVSNVFGYILPVEGLAALCRKWKKPLILDVSQSAGVLELDFDALGADFAAMPGHKGLMGPQGTGVLLCKNDAKPLLYGGSGSASRSRSMPAYLPDRLEAGTHNVTGIAGLNAGVRYVLEKGTQTIRRHERRLLESFARAMTDWGGARLFYSPDGEVQSSVLSLLPRDMSCEALGDALSEREVAVRTGLHCAPAAHQTAGTLDTGTVRFSFSPFNTEEEVLRCAGICEKILKNL
ncbi:MAG: aminotransferase class V-fold PLP-dependent enzyme [Oscillospiraceae bacterium]